MKTSLCFKTFWSVIAVTLFCFNLFAGTYEVGPGLTYTNLGSVPWTGLAPGDTVNVHYQASGYHEIILLSSSGTSNAPITLNGVPDPITGALPTLDGQNAVTATNTAWDSIFFNFEGVVLVTPGRHPYGYIPSWITIQNLHIQNADPTNKLTQSDGTVTNFDTFACCIYVEYAQHLTVRGCELNGSCNGFFCNTKNNDTNELSADMLIEHSYIHDNGYPGNYGVHNIYTEAKGVTFQYNLIGPLRAGADGEQIKDRSSGTVLRYNMMILGPGPGTAFWFEQTQGGIGIIDVDPAYRTNFVYGNVFYNPPNSQSLEMFRYDALGIQGQPRNGTLYFYNNTVVNRADQSARYYTDIFSLPSASEEQEWGVHDVVDCRNNIFATFSVTTNAAPTGVAMLASDDSTINFGTNWVSPGTTLVSLPYGTSNFVGTLTGTNQLIYGDSKNNPGFVNLAATNFQLLATSPCVNAGVPQAPGVAATTNILSFEYVFPTNFQPRSISGAALDLGAFETILTNLAVNLSISLTNSATVTLAWPTNATGYTLQQNSSLTTTNWLSITNVITTNLSQFQLTLPRQPGTEFFRLVHP